MQLHPQLRHRHLQLRKLYDLIATTKKPVIVAGDFNTFWGQDEIYLFMKAAGLQSANTEGLPSYPSRSPRKELDFILYQEGITVTHFEIRGTGEGTIDPRACFRAILANATRERAG